jgi:hypothetical protein
MGFSSLDDWLNKVTVSGQFLRIDWYYQYAGVVGVAGQYRDLNQSPGVGPANIWGERLRNPGFLNSANWWTLGAGWAHAFATQNVTHTAGGGTTSIVQTPNLPIVAGRTYRTSVTSSGVAGSDSFRVKVGGTAGTNRSGSSTYVENIVAGAGGDFEIECDNNRTVTIDDCSLMTPLEFTPYNSGSTGALYHGGDVSPATKHLMAASAWSPATAAVPGVFILCDILGCYPRVDMNTAVAQTLVNNDAIPRYATGAGVRAFVANTVASGATAHNIDTFKYTNSVPTSDRLLPVPVAGTASAGIANVMHSGVAANQYGPFLPMADGDNGVLSVQEFKLSAATAAAGLASIVLARPLMQLPIVAASIVTERDLMSQMPSMPRIFDGAYLGWLFYCGAALANASSLYGHLDVAWG